MPAAAKPIAKQLAQIHAVLGSDESEVKRAARDLATQLVPAEGGEFAQEIIDGTVGTTDEAVQRIHQTIEALLTFPFFGGEKLVWLKNASFLADSPAGKAAGTLEALEKLAETLAGGFPESTRFLLSAIDHDKRRSFYKGLSKVAKVSVFDKLDPSKTGWEEEAAQLVRQAADERGLKLTSEALELFTLYTGGERRVIGNELEKLELYVGQERREIDGEMVRLLVPLSRHGIIWELGNSLSERNVHRSLRLLEQLLFQGETAIGILIVVIIPTVRNLLLVKDLMQRHKLTRPAQPFFFGKTLDRLPPAATAHLPRKKDGGINAFALGLAAQHAQRFQTSELRDLLDACLHANVQLVTSGLDAKVVLSQLVIRIAGEKR
jgi:DNA polymerase-3 subunit delta